VLVIWGNKKAFRMSFTTSSVRWQMILTPLVLPRSLGGKWGANRGPIASGGNQKRGEDFEK
jgi:hypothetical protein